MLDVDRGDPFECRAQLAARALTLEPAVGLDEQLRADPVDDAQREVVPVLEVDVEGGSGEVGALHDRLHGDLPPRVLAQEPFRGIEDLPLGFTPIVPRPATALGGR